MSEHHKQQPSEGRRRQIYSLSVGAPPNDLSVGAPPNESTDPDNLRGTYDLHGSDVRLEVEWDGLAGSMGRMKVEVAEGEWQELEYTQPGVQDTLVPRESPNDTFTASFERGGAHPGFRFEVKAVAIQWKIDPDALAGTERDEFVAVLDQHYEYPNGVNPQDVPYESSAPNGEAHHAEIELTRGQDYELWVRLQSPLDPDDWIEHDPIVRTGSGSSDGSN